MSDSTVVKRFIKHLSQGKNLFINLHLVKVEQNKKLGIEIKENINEQPKIKVYSNNTLTLKEIVDINNIQPLYCNSTNTFIQHNKNLTYISKSIYNNSLKYTELHANGNEFVIGYNINNVRQPDIVFLTINPMFSIELEKGYLFVTKLLDDIEML